MYVSGYIPRKEFVTFAAVENEREVQDTFTHSVEDLIAGGYVAQEQQEDVVQNLSIDTICRKLEHENKKIRMVYRRKVHGSYQWVESVIIPMEDYSRENARVIWMVKSLDDQKSGAMISGLRSMASWGCWRYQSAMQRMWKS